MRYTLLFVATICWGLWFGGTIATFVFGLYFFHHLPHDTFAAAAPAMFAGFRVYEMAVGGVAMLSSGLAFVTYPSRWTLGLLVGFIGAFGMAIIFGLGIMPIMQGLRAQGMAGSDVYMTWHGRSMATMSVQAVILLATGALVPATMNGKPRRGGVPLGEAVAAGV